VEAAGAAAADGEELAAGPAEGGAEEWAGGEESDGERIPAIVALPAAVRRRGGKTCSVSSLNR